MFFDATNDCASTESCRVSTTSQGTIVFQIGLSIAFFAMCFFKIILLSLHHFINLCHVAMMIGILKHRNFILRPKRLLKQQTLLFIHTYETVWFSIIDF